MSTTAAPLTNRDRAVLRAVAAGRCRISPAGGALVVDGLYFADQFAGSRLTEAGLIAAASDTGSALLTASGRALIGTEAA
ncbi:hypothetical protein FHX44_114999 [Pseudonocardia hierapolitana]|uniref:Uncharacterized protein n=1 Tax=Pseudonocardia hierapolitana TaxID=1128676 RepID=A0A561SW29_9PSEU|nr:hypothetical protein [Pseudonocardia hierapolitana]TWF79073.1 hypothetical protein FHX44_114999 [Pseudonocardia hierapolitana]